MGSGTARHGVSGTGDEALDVDDGKVGKGRRMENTAYGTPWVRELGSQQPERTLMNQAQQSPPPRQARVRPVGNLSMGLARRSKRACCSLLLELQGERTAAGGEGGRQLPAGKANLLSVAGPAFLPGPFAAGVMVDGSWKARRLVFRFPPFWRCSTLRPITSFAFPTAQKRAAAESPRLQKRGPQTRGAHRRGGISHLAFWTSSSASRLDNGKATLHWGEGEEGRGRSKSLPVHQSTCRAGLAIGRRLDGRTHGPRPTRTQQQPRQKVPRARFPSVGADESE